MVTNGKRHKNVIRWTKQSARICALRCLVLEHLLTEATSKRTATTKTTTTGPLLFVADTNKNKKNTNTSAHRRFTRVLATSWWPQRRAIHFPVFRCCSGSMWVAPMTRASPQTVFAWFALVMVVIAHSLKRGNEQQMSNQYDVDNDNGGSELEQPNTEATANTTMEPTTASHERATNYDGSPRVISDSRR